MTTTYYYEIPERLDNMPAGIFSVTSETKGSTFSRLTLYMHSERVWVQGPKGGVRLSKENGNPSMGYVTKNEQKMKEFMWVKLKAKEITRRK